MKVHPCPPARPRAAWARGFSFLFVSALVCLFASLRSSIGFGDRLGCRWLPPWPLSRTHADSVAFAILFLVPAATSSVAFPLVLQRRIAIWLSSRGLDWGDWLIAVWKYWRDWSGISSSGEWSSAESGCVGVSEIGESWSRASYAVWWIVWRERDWFHPGIVEENRRVIGCAPEFCDFLVCALRVSASWAERERERETEKSSALENRSPELTRCRRIGVAWIAAIDSASGRAQVHF